MQKINWTTLAVAGLRVALAAGFLSAVASRLGLWGRQSSGWKSFVSYTHEVLIFVPVAFVPFLAVMSTVLESAIGIWLLTGYKTRQAAFAAGMLTLIFAVAMGVSMGWKEPLDYSVFAVSMGGFVLASFR